MGLDRDIEDIEATSITCIHKSWFFEKIPQVIPSIYILIVFRSSLKIYRDYYPCQEIKSVRQ